MPSLTTPPRRRVLPPGPLLLGAAALVAVLAVVELATGLGGLTAAGGALAAVSAGVVLRQQGPMRSLEERGLWRWCGRSVVAVGAGLAAEAVLDLAVRGPAAESAGGLALTVGGVVAVACAHQGMLTWNRFRTSAVHPVDWINFVGSTLGTLALLVWAVAVGVLPADGPGWVAEGHLLRAAALVVLAVMTLVVTVLGGLRDDPRAWLLMSGLGAMAVVELLLLPSASTSGALAVPVVVSWSALTLVTARAGAIKPPPLRGHFASTLVVTTCAMIAVVASTVVLVLDSLRPTGTPVVALLAAAGVVGGCAQLLRTASELAALAATRKEARTDPLTGVANRRAMLEVADRFAAARTGAALLVIDLDRFKDVNDRYGHPAGDAVIRTVSGRLQATLDGGALLARFGGDEFGVVLDHDDVDRATLVAHALRAAVREPIDVTGRVVRLDASIGVASTAFGDHHDGELVRWADTAMYAAKRAGGGVRVYDEAADARDRDEIALGDELRALLAAPDGDDRHGVLELHYQPQLDCAEGRVVGMEALVRWAHPERGLLPPGVFIDLAEQTGSMFALTERVLAQATRTAARWQAEGRDLPVAVNLSTSCLGHPRLLATLDGVLAAAGLRPEALVVEITETTLMHDPPHAVAVTRAIADRGIGLAIDDYGSGYSSLTYLNELPAGELKLDRSFTMRLTSDARTRAIVSGTLELAHHLGLRLIAEGVEDAETAEALRGMGCDRTQGYWHGRPMPLADADAWLRARDDAARAAAVGA
ncbi:bifunctional diguanylate cyclase/phosphodiesterase [Cellulomonas sp. IC4_254]|uniref:putative bifunctional diguanylate cyclase/phosphodiesterase n=1 Tax=Cellulomonas sp. IC4_254 TaxID=2714040 RepID=UPI00142003E8|nr:bifunctional diguanylate cyclase/phosphodiesterase [Cellulomonas sp. IC4_254]NHT18221.1 bifunctional diguanylate cyclase/phosphodiesterase [Cellulomonas sp. IC4_254]